MSMFGTISCDEICARASVHSSDVLAMRKAYYGDAKITAEEADGLFRINACARVQDPAWHEFFIEAVTDYIVNCCEPEGYLNADNARWLIDRIGTDGIVESRTELELLVNVLDKARWAPESLARYALEQVRHAVIEGTGPLRAGQALETGRITDGEIELVRRILFAFAGDGNIAVTRSEAEILIDIDEAAGDSGGGPGWTDFFVKAMANCIMAASGYSVPTREEALRREAWLDRRGELSLENLVGAIADRGLAGIWDMYTEQSSEERALARLERQRIEIITAERVTEGEADWLAQRIGRDGRVTMNERALLQFLKQEHVKLNPALQTLIDSHARAA